MQSVFYEFSASLPTVTIEHTEDLDLRPIRDFGLLDGWLNDVQNNSNSVFIGFPDRADISIGCKGPDRAKALSGHL
jgi:hypothetical protein